MIRLATHLRLWTQGARRVADARVDATEDHQYFVTIGTPGSRPYSSDAVRLVLHAYAKTLFDFGTDDVEACTAVQALQGYWTRVVSGGLCAHMDVARVAEIEDVVTFVSTRPPGPAVGFRTTLYTHPHDSTARHVVSWWPPHAYYQQAAFSVLALLQEVLRGAPSQQIDVLGLAAETINGLYSGGSADPTALSDLARAPNFAYAAAAGAGT